METIKTLVLAVSRFFERTANGEYRKTIIAVFLTGALMTLVGAYLVSKELNAVTFFNYDFLNVLLTYMNRPVIRWIYIFFGYFMFILLVLGLCKALNDQVRPRALILSLMSVSSVGVVSHAVSFILMLASLSGATVSLLTLISVTLVILLSVWAIKVSQGISAGRAIVCFFVPSVPILVLVGLPGISPYLSWL